MTTLVAIEKKVIKGDGSKWYRVQLAGGKKRFVKRDEFHQKFPGDAAEALLDDFLNGRSSRRPEEKEPITNVPTTLQLKDKEIADLKVALELARTELTRQYDLLAQATFEARDEELKATLLQLDTAHQENEQLKSDIAALEKLRSENVLKAQKRERRIEELLKLAEQFQIHCTEKDSVINAVEIERQELVKKVAQSEQKIAESEKVVKGLGEEMERYCAERESEIATLERNLQDKDGQISLLKTGTEKQDQKIAALVLTLAAKDQTQEANHKKLTDFENQLHSARVILEARTTNKDENGKLQKELAEAKAELEKQKAIVADKSQKSVTLVEKVLGRIEERRVELANMEHYTIAALEEAKTTLANHASELQMRSVERLTELRQYEGLLRAIAAGDEVPSSPYLAQILPPPVVESEAELETFQSYDPDFSDPFGLGSLTFP